MADYKNYPPQKTGKGVGFDRIRRITGYLVGTTDKWNDAKKAELADRTVHTTEKTTETEKPQPVEPDQQKAYTKP